MATLPNLRPVDTNSTMILPRARGGNHVKFASMISKFGSAEYETHPMHQNLPSKSASSTASRQNIIDVLRSCSSIGVAARRSPNNFLQNDINPGYITDDEASDDEEPVDSGRTRSAARKANLSNQQSNKTSQQSGTAEGGDSPAAGSRGRKRKQVNPNGDGSDSDKDESNKKSRVEANAEPAAADPPVCSCPRNVMKCIGILPSLPIISCLYDSDDSIRSSNEDLTYTVLPTVSRDRKGHEEC